MCGVLDHSARLLRDERIDAGALMLAATTALACAFRFSLAPFVVPAAGAVLVVTRQQLPRRLVVSKRMPVQRGDPAITRLQLRAHGIAHQARHGRARSISTA